MKNWMHTWMVLALVLVMTAPAIAQDVSFSSQPALIANTTIPGRTSVPNDFNGNGLSELLWFSPETNQLQIWSLTVSSDQKSVTKSAWRTLHITPGYVVGATGDLDGDGKTDFVFTSAKHDLYLWKSVGDGSFISSFIGNYPDGWVLLGAADMDGDGTDDLLWHNPGTCQFGYWRMKSGMRVGAKTFAVDCAYQPVSIGYYGLTNRASIIWMDSAHNLYVWDSVANGFNKSKLGSFQAGGYAYRVGGGHQGAGMTFKSVASDNKSFSYHDFVRNFSIDGRQSSWTNRTSGSGGKLSTEYSGGFVVRAQGFGATEPVTFNTSVLASSGTSTYPRVQVCVPSRQAVDPMTLEPNRTCSYMFPAPGWFPVGYHSIP